MFRAFLGDEILPSYMGMIRNHDKDPYGNNQDSMETRFQLKVREPEFFARGSSSGEKFGSCEFCLLHRRALAISCLVYVSHGRSPDPYSRGIISGGFLKF